MLVKLFKQGKIAAKEQPTSVRSKFSAAFGKCATDQFRSQFSKARNLSGVNFLDDEDEDDFDDDSEEEADDKNVVKMTAHAHKKSKSAMTIDTEEEAHGSDKKVLFWSPKKIVTTHTESDGVRVYFEEWHSCSRQRWCGD